MPATIGAVNPFAHFFLPREKRNECAWLRVALE